MVASRIYKHCDGPTRARSLSLALFALASFAAATAGWAIEPPASEPAWIDYVRPLMTDEELETFLALEHRYQQAEFVERFWEARDPDRGTRQNELRQKWPDRRGTAEQQFGGTQSDRGRTFLLRGPPDFILADLCSKILRPLEVWSYETDSGGATPQIATVVFVASEEAGAHRLWDPDSMPIADLLLPAEADQRPAERRLVRECRRGREVLAALESALGATAAFAPPRMDAWLTEFRRDFIGTSEAPLDVEFSFEIIGRIAEHAEVDAVLEIGSDPAATGPRILEIDGDIFRGERRADYFRYRYELPQHTSGEPAVLRLRRRLVPGSYRAELSVREPAARRSGHFEMPLFVALPQTAAERVADLRGDQPAARTFKIQPLPLSLLTGRQRVEVAASSETVARVDFLLDDRLVMRKRRPPFSVELDLGRRPRTHRLEAVGYDGSGEEVARDATEINAGPHRFKARLVKPRHGHFFPDALDIHVDVSVPPEEVLDRVELFFNETRIATLYQPPFIYPSFELPSTATGYVRAVAILDDGNSNEDLAVINATSDVDSLRVDFVELYAGVVDRRERPVTDLRRDDFTVLEDGIPQAIQRFETVKDLPIHALVVLDTSQSMIEEIDEAHAGALRFFENVLRPQDRAGVVVFSDKPELKVPLTSDLGRLGAGLDNVRAEGETTLHDSVVFGLYYLLGLRGKRALILMTDGLDSQSDYSFNDMVEFARFSSVAIYSIGIGLTSREVEAQRVLRTLAYETGGECYFINDAGELGRIYTKIENALRAQYLLGYQSSQSSGEDFRRVTVKVDRPDLEVKAVPGYYP